MHTYASLHLDPVFVNLFVQEAPDSPIRSGYVGRLLRMKFFMTSNAREYVDGGVTGDDVYSLLILGRESHATLGFTGFDPNLLVDSGGDEEYTLTGQNIKPVEIIVKPVGSSGTLDPLDQRGTIGWKMALTTNILNGAFIRDLEHVNVFSAD